MHGAEPPDALYFPALHGMQAFPSGPLCPGMQVQLVSSRVPAGDLEFSGQGKHFVEPEKFFHVYSGQREQGMPGCKAKKSGLHMHAVMVTL